MDGIVQIQPSEELAYWVGVVQSDGCFRPKWERGRRSLKYLISFGIAEKSLPMVEKIREIASKILNRHGKIYKESERNVWNYCIQIKQFLSLFKDLI